MITRRESKITVDGTERLVDIKELYDLSRKYLPSGMASEYKDKFVDEVIFRISSLEFESIYRGGKSIEEYEVAAGLAYAEENGFSQFFDEEDDGNIFEYCGAELQ